MGQAVVSRSRELTQRDLAIVEWIGRVGAATVDQVARRFGLSRTRAYACVGRCVTMGLLDRKHVLHRAPALLVATREGLIGAGLGLPSVRISPALARHHEACGSVAVWLAEQYPDRSILSDREIRLEESRAGRAIASAKVGELPSGAPRLHRPDFAAVGDGVVAFEVELTPKAPRRLMGLVRAWRRASQIAQVIYLCDSATLGAVERAIARTCSEERVRVAGLSEVMEAVGV
jgi:hypothetical protein